MNSSTRAPRSGRIAVCVVSLACACLALGAVAAAADATIDYQKESYAEYKQQLAGAQIAAVTINKRLRSLRVTLNDGRYVLARYNKHEEPAVAAALQAKKVPVTVLTPTEAVNEEKAQPRHHKLRYIAGGIVIVVIVIVAAVLLFNRKRRRDLE
jgi:xanthine/CO dehydrogenase XdhC/CoxF family maturation factor